jgi:hypothetical protein
MRRHDKQKLAGDERRRVLVVVAWRPGRTALPKAGGTTVSAQASGLPVVQETVAPTLANCGSDSVKVIAIGPE